MMPVAINFEGDIALHPEAEDWRYVRAGNMPEAPCTVQLLDGDGNPIPVDAVVENVCQIQYLTDEESGEVLEQTR